MTWNIMPCKLTEESVEEIKGMPWSSYNPFDHYNGKGEKELYLQFTSIDDNNPNDIFKFISAYGFLGFNHDKERKHQEELKRHQEGSKLDRYFYEKQIEALKEMNVATRQLAINAIKNHPFVASDTINFLESYSKDTDNKIDDTPLVEDTPEDTRKQLIQLMLNLPPENENLEDIKQEIVIMRTLVLLWQEIRAKRRENTLTQMENLCRIDYKSRTISMPIEEYVATIINYEGLNDDFVFLEATETLSRWINKKLDGVRPVLSSSITSDYSFQGLWKAPHLLSSMYVMFYMDLTRGVILRKCQNKTCKDFFAIYGNDERKIYCNEGCASAQKQREYRQRKKEQKLK